MVFFLISFSILIVLTLAEEFNPWIPFLSFFSLSTFLSGIFADPWGRFFQIFKSESKKQVENRDKHFFRI